MLRALLRRLFFTSNTIRYLIEWLRLRDAFVQMPTAHTLFDGGAGAGAGAGRFLRRALAAGFAENDPPILFKGILGSAIIISWVGQIYPEPIVKIGSILDAIQQIPIPSTKSA